MQKLKFVALFIILFPVISPDFCYGQAKGGHWCFENDALDTADWDVLNDPGALQGAAVYLSELPVIEGQAYLWLDTIGVHDYFRIEDSADLDFDNENIAISAWIYPIKMGTDVHWILNKGDQFTNPKTTNYALRISKSGNLEFLIRDANNKAQKVASTFKVPVTQWSFAGVFYDYSEGRVYFWNDPGYAPADTLDFNQAYFSNDDPLSIGSWFSSDPVLPSVMDFEGRIDDVRIGTEISHIIDTQTSISRETMLSSPENFILYQNWPNPFNNQTMLSFLTENPGSVHLEIFNTNGQRMTTVFKGSVNAGIHQYLFDSSGFASGCYIVRLQSKEIVLKKTMILLK